MDIFQMIDQLVYMNEVPARREAAEIIKTDVGKLILENVQQKEKNILLLESNYQKKRPPNRFGRLLFSLRGLPLVLPTRFPWQYSR